MRTQGRAHPSARPGIWTTYAFAHKCTPNPPMNPTITQKCTRRIVRRPEHCSSFKFSPSTTSNNSKKNAKVAAQIPALFARPIAGITVPACTNVSPITAYPNKK